MAYAFVQDVPIDEATYARIRERMGSDPLDGLIVHLALRNDDGTIRYVDVWESREACDATIDARIHPAVGSVFREIGFRPDGEPERQVVQLVEALVGPAAS